MKLETENIQSYFKNFTDKDGHKPCPLKIGVLVQNYTDSYLKEHKLK